MARSAAFFDLDRTLIDINSGVLWARHERRNGNITTQQMSQALFWTAMYHLGLINMDEAFSSAVSHYKGVSFDALMERTHEWFLLEIANRARPRALEALEDHRSQGRPLVLLTNSSCFEASAAAEHWKFNAWLANTFPTDEAGNLLGVFDLPMCYAEGKVASAETWAAENDVDLDESFFYSDSHSDIPMLARVGHPRVVAPDPRLRLEAWRRGWLVLGW